jgi:hypothetical protein
MTAWHAVPDAFLMVTKVAILGVRFYGFMYTYTEILGTFGVHLGTQQGTLKPQKPQNFAKKTQKKPTGIFLPDGFLIENTWKSVDFIGTLGANRTRDTRIRNPVLYPLSYEGMLVGQIQSGGIILKFFQSAILFQGGPRGFVPAKSLAGRPAATGHLHSTAIRRLR